MQVNLVYFKPNGGRKDVLLKKDSVVIGRALDCDVQVPRGGVSRRHCELVAAGQTVKVKDLGSSNGTYVNGERVEEQAVAAGDQLQIGAVVLTLQVDGQPSELSPPPPPKPKAAKAPVAAAAAAGAGDDDDVFAQMMLDDDEDDDDDPVIEVGDPISALDILQEDDEDV